MEEYRESGEIMALERMVKRMSEERMVEFAVEGGVVPVYTIETRRGSYSVVKAFMRKGLVFPRHTHSEIEVIQVIEGRAVYKAFGESTDLTPLVDKELDGKSTDLTPIVEKELDTENCVCVPPDRPHQIVALEDTWFIVVTRPHSEGFAE